MLPPALAMAAGLIVTAALALISQAQYNRNENRLLHLRVRDAGALIAGALPGVQTPLASAAALADATNGDSKKFMRFADVYVGTKPGQFASLSLWRLGSVARGPVAVAGAPPKLARSPATAEAFLSTAARRPQLNVLGLLGSPDPRLGFAYTEPGVRGQYVAYAENRLPASRRSRLQSSNQFSGLHYAMYLGTTRQPQNLLVTDVTHPPLPGRSDAVAVPFGNTALTLVMSSQRSLAGSLPQQLPWIIAIGGLLLSLAATAAAGVLARRRHSAELLAIENRALYAEQRGIAQTLQDALLPDRLPQLHGIEASGHYEAGEHGVDIGGDWYDVIDLGQRRLLVVIGDVTGRGVRAAAMMARLRFAVGAYAPDDADPAAVLNRLSRLVTIADGGQLATILCALIDIDARSIRVASAGHLPPLLIHNGTGTYVESEVGIPIGIEPAQYTASTISAPPGATLLAFTDGLVEHRGEDLDESLERLRGAAVGRDLPMPELFSSLVTELQSGAAADDIAIVGVRWKN
jgi:serine phosphatase RsbU (regulator of sigma subunit)